MSDQAPGWHGEHQPGDPQPPVDTVLEVGSVPDPERGFSGDLLTFTRLESGWVRQHNRAPQLAVVDWPAVEFWAPLRVVHLGTRAAVLPLFDPALTQELMTA